jgi:hypothetical protein
MLAPLSIGCTEAPQPAPKQAAAPASQALPEVAPPMIEPSPVIPIDPPRSSSEGAEGSAPDGRKPIQTDTNPPTTAAESTPPAPSSVRALGNAIRRAFGGYVPATPPAQPVGTQP